MTHAGCFVCIKINPWINCVPKWLDPKSGSSCSFFISLLLQRSRFIKSNLKSEVTSSQIHECKVTLQYFIDPTLLFCILFINSLHPSLCECISLAPAVCWPVPKASQAIKTDFSKLIFHWTLLCANSWHHRKLVWTFLPRGGCQGVPQP